jgi:DNA-directed RNA polymerase subunit M/transcription elongation factor TFIIS
MARPRCPSCGKLMNLTREKDAAVDRCSSCDQVDPMKTEAAKWAQSPLSPPR